MEAEAAFAVGSGTRGRSYLINRDGYLFQSPVTWFGQKNRWDLSPGFRFRFELFERPISPECLFCHSNYADHVEDTINRYREPVFHGHAIGCERCHGPGELHVRRREAAEVVEGLDDTIVNPRHLEPHLRDAVCEQCHLEGVSRVVRRGRAPFDYRPGLPVHLFWAIFVRPTEAAEAHTVVNHVEQMQASRCYQASQGKLGCISCHDPHERPVPEQQLAYYRARCLACHEDGTGRSLAATGRSTGCSLSPASRQKKDDNCFGCHMPRRDSSDIVHVAVTDHRVLRRAEDAGRPAGQHAGEMGRERSLVLFHRDEEQAGARELRRSLGLALLQQPGLDGGLGRQAVELLEEAVKDVPEDVAAWEGLGYALWKEGQPHAALEACEAALARAPRREFTLKTAAHVAAELKQHDRAIAYWQRALDVNPSPTSYRHQLAKLYAAKQDWEKAAAECQRVLQTNPAHPQTRLLLVSYYLRAGDRERARAEFERVLAFDPPNPEELRRWFAQQVR
jgi:predicted CXXCH cytochrome family protein